jgi:hypothetical protein
LKQLFVSSIRFREMSWLIALVQLKTDEVFVRERIASVFKKKPRQNNQGED